jgi:hypothetical protein
VVLEDAKKLADLKVENDDVVVMCYANAGEQLLTHNKFNKSRGGGEKSDGQHPQNGMMVLSVDEVTPPHTVIRVHIRDQGEQGQCVHTNPVGGQLLVCLSLHTQSSRHALWGFSWVCCRFELDRHNAPVGCLDPGSDRRPNTNSWPARVVAAEACPREATSFAAALLKHACCGACLARWLSKLLLLCCLFD